MEKNELRALVRTLYDMQDMRMRMSNRELVKADGMSQKDNGTRPPKSHDQKVSWYTYNAMKRSEDAEEALKKALAEEVSSYPIYQEFLSKVKGCGPMMSAVIISEIDIEKAYTRSALNQFAGMNPGMVKGRRKVDGKIVQTDELVKGDKLTKGFLSPYNKFLKTKMLGVLADCFIKLKSEYTKYYYDYKNRLENEEVWKDSTAAHRNAAAKRYMMKMFLGDLYEKWRALEGLEVRCPYEEEYLGHVHHTKVEEVV